MILCITLGALLLQSANAVHFDGMSVVCAMQCDWGLEDLGRCAQRDNFASCVDKCGKGLPTNYMKRSHREYRDIFCRIRNSTLSDAVQKEMIRFGHSCMPQKDECMGLLKCLGSIREASLGKQGSEKDVLKIVEIEHAFMYIVLAAADPKLDIPQRYAVFENATTIVFSCADVLSGKDA